MAAASRPTVSTDPDARATSCVAIVGADGRLEDGASRAVVPWWSFTKTLIAAAVLRLAERRRLTLDERLDGLPFTLRQLMQHRAGVGNYGQMAAYHQAVARGDEPWSEDEFLVRVPADQLLYPPGEGWAYSNIGYLLLRRLLVRRSGVAFAELLHDLVLSPLGLPRARLAETPADMRDTVFDDGSGYDPRWVSHGTVVGPVAEAALALDRLLGGDFLEPMTLRAMLDAHPLGGPLPGRPWLTTGYGLGLMMGTMQGAGVERPLAVAGHSAGGPGSAGAVYRTLVDGERRTAAVFVAGTDEGPAEAIALRRLVPCICAGTDSRL